MPRTATPKHSRQAMSKRKESPPAPKQIHERPELPKAHELIVDAVADMLTHGGASSDVDALITAAMRHRWGATSTDDDEDYMGEFIRKTFEQWKSELTVYWGRNLRGQPGSFEAKTITDRIRENVRESLWDKFRKFIDCASPEEQHIMNEMLALWDPAAGAYLRDDDIRLGYAFQCVLGNYNETTMIKVPKRLLNKVQEYVDALRTEENSLKP